MDVPTYLEVYRLDLDEEDDEIYCAICGEEFEGAEEFVNHPAPWTGIKNAIVTAHAGCAVRNGYRLTWPS